ncbi:MAG: hypothetical protein M3Y87_34350 [Myxococcota bacterium]|nr:hypothetical protein [Myxococcota bacterium]
MTTSTIIARAFVGRACRDSAADVRSLVLVLTLIAGLGASRAHAQMAEDGWALSDAD